NQQLQQYQAQQAASQQNIQNLGALASAYGQEKGQLGQAIGDYEQSPTKVTVPAPTLGSYIVGDNKKDTTEPTTDAQPTTTAAEATASETTKGRADALETMLAADVSLRMPTKSGHVLRTYSKDSIYFKTLNVWKPHTGIDFDGELGDDVFSMLSGEVTKVDEDRMFGKTVEVSVNNVVIGYTGLGKVRVKKGDKLERGDKLGTIGVVPMEADAPSHIHVYVKVNGAFADPISFVDNDR
ncbi:MAG: M23 family metallopeptidase, partial [Ruminococcus sp.]|nr:M23 family metallopeptidase [Ruminococcus sp.]